MGPNTAVREGTAEDMKWVVAYFHDSSKDFLTLLGADIDLLPSREAWLAALLGDLQRPLPDREKFYVVWEVDGVAVGHSNLSDIEYGRVANMHLHLWKPAHRRRGVGRRLVRSSIDLYFDRFELETLLCEPHAKNEAPNRTLPHAGFRFVERYFGVPGTINFPQDINRWELTRARWQEQRAARSRP